jgi:hypothetical protein
MSISNYTKPQSFIQQYLQVLADSLSADMNAFIYGSHYRLSRYTDSGEKALTQTAAVAATVNLDADLAANKEVLDEDFVKVYVENGEANVGDEIGNADADVGFVMVATSAPHKIYYSEDISTLATPSAVPKVDGRAIQVGDYLDLTDTDGGLGATVRRQVTAIEDLGGVEGSVLVLDGSATADYVTNPADWTADPGVDGPANHLNAQLVAVYTGEIATTEYTVDADGATFAALPDITVPGTTAPSTYTLTTGVGTYYLHYRARVLPSANEPIRKIRSTDDVNTYFGVVDPDNDLAFGLQTALNGSQGKEVYGARVADEDVEAYADVLKKATTNRNLYVHSPLTFDSDIQNSVASHVNAMSQWDVKRWRRAYVASDTPDGYVKLDQEADGTDYVASIDTEGVLTLTSGNLDFVTAGVEAEDIIRTNFSNDSDPTTYQDTFVVESVLGPETLLLKTAPDSALVGDKIEVWAGNTGRAQAQYAANRSQSFGTRRVINVWCDNGTIQESDGATRVVDNRYLACEIAGLRSASLPHQGLTRTEISCITDAPLMYTKYTDDDLDIAAAAGTFIITQDLEDGPVYIRHQLTTETDKGSLYYEDSVGSNIDDVSFGIADIVEGYIGKRNATQDTVTELRNRINEYLHNKSRANRTVLIGPQIIDWDKADLSVEIDSVLRDRINVKITLTVPLPLNTIVVEIFAGVTFNN